MSSDSAASTSAAGAASAGRTYLITRGADGKELSRRDIGPSIPIGKTKEEAEYTAAVHAAVAKVRQARADASCRLSPLERQVLFRYYHSLFGGTLMRKVAQHQPLTSREFRMARRMLEDCPIAEQPTQTSAAPAAVSDERLAADIALALEKNDDAQ